MAATGALILLASLVACGAVDREPEGALDLDEGVALRPPDDLGDRAITSLLLLPRPVPGWGEGTVVVTEVDGDVIAVSELPLSIIERNRGRVDDYGPPGPSVNGLPTHIGDGGFSTLRGQSLLLVRGDAAIELSSRTASVEALIAVAREVDVPTSSAGAVPGAIIGTIARAGESDQVALAYYSPTDGLGADGITVYTAGADEQRALLALAHQDRASLTQMATEASCCAPDLLRPARTLSVHGVDATVATFSASTKILVVPGDPGIVVLSRGVRSYEGVPSDEMLAAVAEGSRVVDPSDLAGEVSMRERAELERISEELHRQESARGWQVVEELVVDGTPVLLTTGTTARNTGEPPLPSAQVCAVFGELSGSSPPTICVPAAPSVDPLVVAPADSVMNGLWFGVVGAGVDSIRLEADEGGIEGRILSVAGARVFVLVGDALRLLELSAEGVTTEAMARMTFVARDGAGGEAGRVPLFPHLQGG